MAEKKQFAVYGPEGLVVWFPEGTPQETVNEVMSKAWAAKQAEKPTASIGKDVIGRVGVGQGLGMGFGDEVTAFAREKIGGEDYDNALADERAKIAKARKDYPIGTTSAEIGGALAPTAVALAADYFTGGAATPAAAPVIARTTTLLGNAARGLAKGVALGGGTGAVQGFGQGENGLENRAWSATEGGVIGSLVGGGLGVLAPFGGAALRSWAAKPETRGSDHLLDTFAREGRTPADILKEYTDRQALGAKPEIVPDLFPGQNGVMMEAQRVMKTPGANRVEIGRQLADRMDEQGKRVVGDFQNAMGTDKKFYSVLDDLEAKRSADAEPLYRAAYAKPIRNTSMDQVLLRQPDWVWTDVKELARTKGLDIPDIVVTDRSGRRAIGYDYTTRDVDLVKRALDDQINALTDPVTGKVQSKAQRYIDLKNQITTLGDQIVPEWGAARNAWAGPSAVKSAMEMGQRIFNERGEVTFRDIMKMNASERDGFLIGALDAVSQRVGRKIEGYDTTGAFRGGNAKEQLSAALTASGRHPQEVKMMADALFANVEREAQMARTNNALRGGSPTYPLQAADQAFRDSMSTTRNVINDFRTGGMGGGAVGTLGRMGEALAVGLTEEGAQKTNKFIADILFRNNPQMVQEAMDMLSLRAAQRNKYPRVKGWTPGLLANPVVAVQE